MKKILFQTVSCFITLCSALPALSDDVIPKDAPPVNLIVEKALSLRASIVAGEYDYKIEYKKTGDNTVASTQQGTYAFDDREGKSLHTYIHSTRSATDPKDTLTVIEGGVYQAAPLESMSVARDLSESFTTYGDNVRKIARFKPFEFRSLGFGFIGDFRRNSDFEKVFAGYRRCKPESTPRVQLDTIRSEHISIGRISSKSNPELVAYDFGGSTLCFDTEREFWPIHQEFTQSVGVKKADGRYYASDTLELLSATDLELTKFNDRWVPKRAIVRGPDDNFTLDIKWKQLNPKIEQMHISFDHARGSIQELYIQASKSNPSN